MNEINETMVVLGDDGGVYSLNINQRRLNVSDEVLSRALAGSWIKAPAVAIDRKMVINMAISQTGVCLHTELRTLRISSRFELVNGLIVPQFRNREDGHEAVMTWKAPENMVLAFVVIGQYVNGKWIAQGGNAPLCYLVARHVTEKGWFKLPLTNTYPDARLCMGAAPRASETASGLLINALDSFFSSRFNADLREYTKPENTRAIFAWNPNEVQVATPTDWFKHCDKVNSTMYDHIQS